ncbi:MAG: transglutaminase domain-containing protein [Oscillospiraceae bacterium]|nr:transglutaminase domain-containing protein [Oscillospiraceae bacterium]
MTAERKHSFTLCRCFAVMCVIFGAYFSFVTAVSEFVLIDVFTLAAVLFVIWAVASACELILPTLSPKMRKAVTIGAAVLVLALAAFSAGDVIRGMDGFVKMFADHVSDREVTVPQYDPSATVIGFAAVFSPAVAFLGTKRNSLPLVVLLTFPLAEVCLYFALVPQFTAFAALMTGYAALGAMDFTAGEDTGKAAQARSQTAAAASLLMGLSITVGGIYAAAAGRSEAADKFRDNFVNYASTFSPEKFAEDVRHALLPSKDHALTHDGQLGNVEEVEFKGTSMLEVTVPSDIPGIYLKGFTGTSYNGTRWHDTDPLPSLSTNITSPEFFTGRMLKLIPGYTELPAEYVVVRNADSAPNTRYFPQNSAGLIETDGIRRKYWAYIPREKGWYADLIGRTPVEIPDLPQDMADDEMLMRSYAYDKCLAVPPSFRAADEFFEGFDGGTLPQTLAYIHDKLGDEYDYTLESGKMPFGQDFADWFLTENGKGSCTHFASAAVLLCRCRGIPARYCEGFIIKPADIDRGVHKSGYTTVTVPDNRCHAWAEVYLDGFGWVVFETTPGYGNIMYEEGDPDMLPMELTAVTTNAPEYPEDLFPDETQADETEPDETESGIMGSTEEETGETGEDTSTQTMPPETAAEEETTVSTDNDREDTPPQHKDITWLLNIIAVIAVTAALLLLVTAIRKRIYAARRELLRTAPEKAAVQVFRMLASAARSEGMSDGTDSENIAALAQKFGDEAKLIAETALKARFAPSVTSDEAKASSDAYDALMGRYLSDKTLRRMIYTLICRDRWAVPTAVLILKTTDKI